MSNMKLAPITQGNRKPATIGVVVRHTGPELCGSCSVAIEGYRTVGATSCVEMNSDYFMLVPVESDVKAAFGMGIETDAVMGILAPKKDDQS